MLVEVFSSVQAQRLQNSGYNRTGENAVEAPLEALDEIIANDDVSVKKISLRRANGDAEAEVIDDLINQGYEGKVTETYTIKTGYSPGKPKAKKVFKLDDSSVTIYKNYQDVVAGDVNEVTVGHEKFEEAKRHVISNIDDDIEDLQEELEQKKSKRNNLEDLEYEEWIENGATRLN